ncbi:MAG TPA: hypothetical protein VES61_07905 [Gaiellaceae bacterium]|nr:hypothetical protein [Gaiellaceae bacterium]
MRADEQTSSPKNSVSLVRAISTSVAHYVTVRTLAQALPGVECIYSVHPSEQGIRTWLRTWTPPVPAKQSGTLGTAPMEAGLRS